EAQQAQLSAAGEKVKARLVADASRLDAVQARRESLRDVLKLEDFQEIHWQPLAARIVELEEEKRRLEAGSDVLRTLQAQLEAAERGILTAEGLQRKTQYAHAEQKTRLDTQQAQHAEATELFSSLSEAERARLFPPLAEMQAEALGEKKLSVENCDKSQTEMREWLQGRLDALAKRIAESEKGLLLRMAQYKQRYPQETREVDASIEAEPEYREMLATLRREDLPRHEQNFKTLLNERTINGIALLQSWLDNERQGIADKIATINRSLKEIEYASGTYIELVGDRTQDPEIRSFRQELLACLSDTLGGGEDELYAEHKFLQVKALIDRFNGREGTSELDRRWTQKVTDVRNWFVFSASERWREDGTEKEFYSDSAGKSGGQKEKLAYTILASALAYQFGLEWGEVRSRTFRFVMIDEAFGRGSDESARYGLGLFRKLNLQLLIVTPLQKIHVIEDYVKSVHFVHNEGGRDSRILGLTIAQYKERKAREGDTAGVVAP
ncbi:MAG TPA: SbcC/MukB-like Walker B domain-containing protein, partial [Pantanalinema sp.]